VHHARNGCSRWNVLAETESRGKVRIGKLHAGHDGTSPMNAPLRRRIEHRTELNKIATFNTLPKGATLCKKTKGYRRFRQRK
jgi:hypothetical protein